ncbi:hypothetical protein FA13DRAFT_961347 [Coprinellus micaceus]|uniref:Uncharacterized protein n=1 Tax=Coprinellus micaceus TaxID=71717 RepID=A0A4Y7SZN7_COPMI|nr:hypothetical protein FA13DRAFT_961347 [Coprinellus micaceus]
MEILPSPKDTFYCLENDTHPANVVLLSGCGAHGHARVRRSMSDVHGVPHRSSGDTSMLAVFDSKPFPRSNVAPLSKLPFPAPGSTFRNNPLSDF